MPKIVCISDTHEEHRNIEVPDGDILLCAGDMTFHGDKHRLEDFNAWIGDLPHKHKIVIAGNHELSLETHPELYEPLFTNCTYLNLTSTEVMGLKIFGVPHTPRFFDWAFNVDRGHRMRQIWDKVPKDTNVLLTHGPPYKIGDITLHGEHVGCYDQSMLLDNLPALQLVVCGHIHPGYGSYPHGNTTVVNASICNEKYNPINLPIVVDL